ncbi:uncharacterized protein LOC143981569 [Lithobates pipiens]
MERSVSCVLLLLCGLWSWVSPVPLTIHTEVGEEVTLEPQYSGDPSEINWKINGNKLVDMELKPRVDILFYQLGDRATINEADGRLTIKNLTVGDSGVYKVEVLVNNVIQGTEIILIVQDEVSPTSTSTMGPTYSSGTIPVSDPVLDVRCLQNGSVEISCWVEIGTDPSIYLTVSGGLEVYDVTSSERTVRVTVPPVSPPHSWNIRCSAKNSISERSTNQTQDPCPGEVWPGIRHLLSPIAVFVLYTVLLIFIVNDLRKMKDEKNRSERKTRRRDQMEMEMEPTYYNDRN